MPEEYRDSKALVLCNDCSTRSMVPYHFVGLKCALCRSYNTVKLQVLGIHGAAGPGDAGVTDFGQQPVTSTFAENAPPTPTANASATDVEEGIFVADDLDLLTAPAYSAVTGRGGSESAQASASGVATPLDELGNNVLSFWPGGGSAQLGGRFPMTWALAGLTDDEEDDEDSEDDADMEGGVQSRVNGEEEEDEDDVEDDLFLFGHR